MRIGESVPRIAVLGILTAVSSQRKILSSTMWTQETSQPMELIIEDSESRDSSIEARVEESEGRKEARGEPNRVTTEIRKKQTKEKEGEEGEGKKTLAMKLVDREITRDAGHHIFDTFLKKSLKIRRKFSFIRWGVKSGGVLFTTKCPKTYKLMIEEVDKGIQWRGSKVVRCAIEDLEKRSTITIWCSHSTMSFKDMVEALDIEYPTLGARAWTLWKEAEPEDKGREFMVKASTNSAQYIRRTNGRIRLCGGVIRLVCKIT
ncbi:hypothetical protein WN55_01199 [Dufourea novaeangliae]|uniref:DUF4780 domain-containing protein n=1 Tax=Dufourea novaeangliae TaxID=178035 RepID=A0A154PDY1_DUFNO|nr:hypothetical protein WN55_01199 [Dufourea novaeangliae]